MYVTVAFRKVQAAEMRRMATRSRQTLVHGPIEALIDRVTDSTDAMDFGGLAMRAGHSELMRFCRDDARTRKAMSWAVHHHFFDTDTGFVPPAGIYRIRALLDFFLERELAEAEPSAQP
jgi:hypothetical protein